MTHARLRLRRLGWIAYGRVGGLLLPLPIWRLGVGERSLGEHLDTLVRKFLPAPGPERTVTLWNGCNLTMPANYQDFTLYEGGMLEPDTTRTFVDLLAPGGTFVDVGAHLGYFSLIASRLVGPAGRIYAFEPDPHHYGLLVRNLQANGCANATAVPMALADQTGARRFFSQPRSSGSSLHRNAGRSVVTRVQAITLDGFLAAQGWPAVDLVKIDIEGGELFALRGMQETLRRNPTLKLIVEFEPRSMRLANVPAAELLGFLRQAGFERILVIGPQPEAVSFPDGIPALVSLARKRLYVNLLCTRDTDCI